MLLHEHQLVNSWHALNPHDTEFKFVLSTYRTELTSFSYLGQYCLLYALGSHPYALL